MGSSGQAHVLRTLHGLLGMRGAGGVPLHAASQSLQLAQTSTFASEAAKQRLRRCVEDVGSLRRDAGLPRKQGSTEARGHAFFGAPAQVAKMCNVQVHELFLEQAKLTPTATALVLPHEAKTVVTYQEWADVWVLLRIASRCFSLARASDRSSVPTRRGAGRSRAAVGRSARTARLAPDSQGVVAQGRSMRVSPARRERRDRGFIFAAKQRAGGVDPRRFAGGCRLPAHGRHGARGARGPVRHA